MNNDRFVQLVTEKLLEIQAAADKMGAMPEDLAAMVIVNLGGSGYFACLGSGEGLEVCVDFAAQQVECAVAESKTERPSRRVN